MKKSFFIIEKIQKYRKCPALVIDDLTLMRGLMPESTSIMVAQACLKKKKSNFKNDEKLKKKE